MSTLTITEFLEARLSEDEALARGALGLHWDGSAYQQVRTVSGDDPHYYKVASGQVGLEHWEPRERLDPGATFKHMARHDPARVLAECAAKRAIIAAHPIVDDVVEVSTRIKHGFACETCFSYGDIVEDNGYCDTLRALAAIYKDHPDYDPEWAL